MGKVMNDIEHLIHILGPPTTSITQCPYDQNQKDVSGIPTFDGIVKLLCDQSIMKEEDGVFVNNISFLCDVCWLSFIS